MISEWVAVVILVGGEGGMDLWRRRGLRTSAARRVGVTFVVVVSWLWMLGAAVLWTSVALLNCVLESQAVLGLTVRLLQRVDEENLALRRLLAVPSDLRETFREAFLYPLFGHPPSERCKLLRLVAAESLRFLDGPPARSRRLIRAQRDAAVSLLRNWVTVMTCPVNGSGNFHFIQRGDQLVAILEDFPEEWLGVTDSDGTVYASDRLVRVIRRFTFVSNPKPADVAVSRQIIAATLAMNRLCIRPGSQFAFPGSFFLGLAKEPRSIGALVAAQRAKYGFIRKEFGREIGARTFLDDGSLAAIATQLRVCLESGRLWSASRIVHCLQFTIGMTPNAQLRPAAVLARDSGLLGLLEKLRYRLPPAAYATAFGLPLLARAIVARLRPHLPPQPQSIIPLRLALHTI